MDSVIAVYQKKNPKRKGLVDVKIWCPEQGFLVPIHGFANRQTFWAEVVGGSSRVEIKFSKRSERLFFPEELARLEPKCPKARRSWESIKRAVIEFFGGPKPDDISWKRAKQMLVERQKKEEGEEAGEMPRLLGRGYKPPQRVEAVRRRKPETVSCISPMAAPWPS